MKTTWKIEKICDNLKELLIEKNKRYGDSAIDPPKIFSVQTSANSIQIRIDDKLARIKNSKSLRKNDVVDLTGYLVLLMAEKEWLSFKDLID